MEKYVLVSMVLLQKEVSLIYIGIKQDIIFLPTGKMIILSLFNSMSSCQMETGFLVKSFQLKNLDYSTKRHQTKTSSSFISHSSKCLTSITSYLSTAHI